MEIIEWNVDDIQQTVDSLDEMILANNLINEIKKDDFDTDEIRTKDAIAVCKNEIIWRV